jgi:ribose 5-phosphate isomerase B
MRFAVASDHAGYPLKQAILETLTALGHQFEDLGTDSDAVSVDYPDFAQLVAHAIMEGRAERGILICGTGVGMSIAANRVPGIRAVVAALTTQVRLARAHNDANVLCVGSRITGTEVVRDLVATFVATDFEVAPRHEFRIKKIDGA